MQCPRRPSVRVLPALLIVATALAGSPVWSAAKAQTPPAGNPAPPPAAPQAGALSLGPGLFTFPQIAALLSTPDQPITCDFAMKDWAAFVFLQNRSRAEAKELLGAGLQVEFLPAPPPASGVTAQEKAANKPGSLVMTRQKAVSEREAAWLKRLARVVQNELQRKAGEVAAYDNKPLPDFAKIKKMGDEASALYRQIGNLDEPPKNEAMAQKRAEWDKLHIALTAENAVPNASQRILAAWVRNQPASLVPVLQGKQDDFVPQTAPPPFVQNGWAAQALLDGVKEATNISLSSLPTGFRPENYTWATRYEIDPLLFPQFSIRVESRVSHVPTAASESLLVTAQHPAGKREPESEAEKENATALFYLNRGSRSFLSARLPNDIEQAIEGLPGALLALGSDAIAWWKQEKADTDACLPNLPAELPAPQSPLTAESPVLGGETLVGVGHSNSHFMLSDAAAYFAAKNHTEMVMELHPRFEWQQTHAASPNLSAWISSDGVGEQWTAREKNKVLLITNRLAFLERPQNVPLGELLQLRSDLQDWHKQNDAPRTNTSATSPRAASPEYLPYAPLAAYARAVMARRDGHSWTAVMNSGIDLYHGIHLNVLDENVAAIYLWSKISEADRSKIVASLTSERAGGDPPKGGKGRVRYYQYPMSRLSGATLSAAAQFMHELNRPETETSELVNQLRSCNLRAAWIISHPANVPKFYRLSLSFVPGSPSTNAQINSQTQILIPNPTREKAAP